MREGVGRTKGIIKEGEIEKGRQPNSDLFVSYKVSVCEHGLLQTSIEGASSIVGRFWSHRALAVLWSSRKLAYEEREGRREEEGEEREEERGKVGRGREMGGEREGVEEC